MSESLERRRQMLRTALGATIGSALADPDVVEIMVNLDGCCASTAWAPAVPRPVCGGVPSTLPDRKPVKMTITLSAELAAKLRTYAALYRQLYGETEGVADLVSFMLTVFIHADRNFAKAHVNVRVLGPIGDAVSEIEGDDRSPRSMGRAASG